MPPDAVACVLTIVRANPRGDKSIGAIVGYFYEVATRADARVGEMAERPVRRALEELMKESAIPRLTEDQAYDQAYRRALLAQFYARSSRIELSPRRQALQHILAAEHIGVSSVGFDLVEGAVISQGWATGSAAATLTEYLNLTLQRVEEHQHILRTAEFEALLESARCAAELQEIASIAPQLLAGTDFSWILTVPEEYISGIKLQLAFMMDDQLMQSAHIVLSDATLMAELEQAKQPRSSSRRPRRMSRVEDTADGLVVPHEPIESSEDGKFG
jgi:hypothetical protein